MPRRTRRRPRRAVPALPERERDRLISYLPTQKAPPLADEAEAVEARVTPHPRTASATEPRPLGRDYSHVPAELRRVFVLAAAIVALLIVLAVVLR